MSSTSEVIRSGLWPLPGYGKVCLAVKSCNILRGKLPLQTHLNVMGDLSSVNHWHINQLRASLSNMDRVDHCICPKNPISSCNQSRHWTKTLRDCQWSCHCTALMYLACLSSQQFYAIFGQKCHIWPRNVISVQHVPYLTKILYLTRKMLYLTKMPYFHHNRMTIVWQVWGSQLSQNIVCGSFSDRCILTYLSSWFSQYLGT